MSSGAIRMTMTGLDWAIVIGCVGALTWFSLRTAKYMRGAADFLSANRSIGRYMLALDASVGGLAAVGVIAYFEQYYDAGFPAVWWTWMTLPGIMIITLTGWVYYRFRETRCLTLAQFFEARYSRGFRILAGMIAWLSGMLNFAIFPYVASNFFVYFCGLSPEFVLFGITLKTFWVIMVLTTGMAVLYTALGGQITVAVTDCLQGMFVNIGFVILIIFLMIQFAWPKVVESLQTAPINAAREKLENDAKEKKVALEEAKKRGVTTEAAEREKEYEELVARVGDPEALREEAKGKSLLNPFDTGKVKSFGLVFFLIIVFNDFYGIFSWQGSQAYRSSGSNPHEQKMGKVIFWWLYSLRFAGLVVLAVCALAFLTHPSFAAQSAEARQAIAALKNTDTPRLAVQQRVPIALAYMLPAGLRGFFCVMMVFLLITTQDTYMHSWGSIFIQDVVMPFRKRPLSPKAHVNALRWSIVLVAVVAVVSGFGCAIIGGLYWRYGGTIAAYVSVVVGALLAIARIVLKQYEGWVSAIPDKGLLLRFIDWQNHELTSQVVWFFIMLTCIALYILLSLLFVRRPFNLERMLHRGKYDVKREHKKAVTAVRSVWLKLIGITREFSLFDRVLAIAMIIWNSSWVAIFALGAAYNFLIRPVPAAWWPRFWHVWIYIQVAFGAPVAIAFLFGGIRDLKNVFKRLSEAQRDETDDGRVVAHDLAGDVMETDNSGSDKA